MKKIIISAVLLSVVGISGVHARCLYQEITPSCSILGETYTNTCSGLSDTSTWRIPIAYQGECETKIMLNQKTKDAISSILYKFLDKKDYIETQTDTNYTLTNEGKQYIQDSLFPVIQRLIATEIAKTSPNHTKIAIYNELVSLVGYDYYMKK